MISNQGGDIGDYHDLENILQITIQLMTCLLRTNNIMTTEKAAGVFGGGEFDLTLFARYVTGPCIKEDQVSDGS